MRIDRYIYIERVGELVYLPLVKRLWRKFSCRWRPRDKTARLVEAGINFLIILITAYITTPLHFFFEGEKRETLCIVERCC